jgi:hypothetical protein
MEEEDFTSLEDDYKEALIEMWSLEKKSASNKQRISAQRRKMKRQNALIDENIEHLMQRAERKAFRVLKLVRGVRGSLRESGGSSRRNCLKQLRDEGL